MGNRVQKILVTGNGFDLYHGLKTNYTDFVKCVEEAFAVPQPERSAFQVKLTQLCNVNGFFRHFHFSLSEDASWTYFDGEMDNILRALTHFQDVVVENQKDPEYDLISYNIIGGLFSYNDLQIFKHFARVFEQVYDDPSGGLFKLRQQYITPEKVLDVPAMIAEVRRELDDFTEALNLYFLEHVMNGAGNKLSAQICDFAPDYVINMNYTDTVKNYGVSDEQIFYAKGRAGEPGNLVLGAPDESEDHMDWAYLRNYYQSLMRFVGLPERAALHPADESGNPVPVHTAFFGYSFPDEDAQLVRELAETAETVKIFYTDREDYARKMLRLLKLFGKDAVRRAVYDGKLIFEEVR